MDKHWYKYEFAFAVVVGIVAVLGMLLAPIFIK